MGAIDNTQGTAVLKAMLAIASLTAAVTPTKIRLGSDTPNATTNMTQLTGGSGYTTGGSTIAWNTVTNMATTNSGAITWTNTGSAWSIVGAEIWDSAGTPLRWLYGVWNGQPIPIATNNAFQLAAGGASVALS